MYNVQMPARYNVAQARKRFSELLDRAQKGEDIVIERRGARFQLIAAEPPPRKPRRSIIVAADEAVLSGQWTWTLGDDGLMLVTPDKADGGS